MGAQAPVDPLFAPLKQMEAEFGLQIYVVGGYVRDRLLGREHLDLDLVVEGDAASVATRLAQVLGTAPPVLFPRFGTSQVTVGDRRLEFVSARAESYPSRSRKPEVRAASLEEDLLRRDFTVNALLMDLDGGVIDRVGGLADLESRRLRTPRDPDLTFADDPLRMLRAVRFAAQLGFGLDPGLLPAMRRQRSRLNPPIVSWERSGEEVRRMILSERPALAVRLLQDAELLASLLPSLVSCRGRWADRAPELDAWDHSLRALELAPRDLETRLACLLHEAGRQDLEAVGRDLMRLRFSRRETERVQAVIRLHRDWLAGRDELSDIDARRFIRRARDLVEPALGLAEACEAALPDGAPARVSHLRERLGEVGKEHPSRLAAPVSGAEVMEALGLPSGPRIGRIKERLDELVLEGRLEADREAILRRLKEDPGLSR